MLKGTLYLPQGVNLPSIVLTHGSGKEERHMRAYQYQGGFLQVLAMQLLFLIKEVLENLKASMLNLLILIFQHTI